MVAARCPQSSALMLNSRRANFPTGFTRHFKRRSYHDMRFRSLAPALIIALCAAM